MDDLEGRQGCYATAIVHESESERDGYLMELRRSRISSLSREDHAHAAGQPIFPVVQSLRYPLKSVRGPTAIRLALKTAKRLSVRDTRS